MTLTEQLKSGTLPKGKQYFVKISDNKIVAKFYGYKGFKGIVKEVLAVCDYNNKEKLDIAVKALEQSKEQLERIEDYTGKHFTQPNTAYWQVQSTKQIINESLTAIRGIK